MSALLPIFTPGRECVGTGLLLPVHNIAIPSRNVGAGALTPRRVWSVVGASRVAGLRLNRNPADLSLAQSLNRLSQGSAGQIIREAVRHVVALWCGLCRAERESCHGAELRSVAP